MDNGYSWHKEIRPFSTIEIICYERRGESIIKTAHTWSFQEYHKTFFCRSRDYFTKQTNNNRLPIKDINREFRDIIIARGCAKFFHEAIGHSIEADSYLSNNSILYGKLGCKIGSELLNIYDDPTIKGLNGSFKIDDEGNIAQKKYLVKNGVLVDLLYDSRTAGKNNKFIAGNARRRGYQFETLPRMSNTIIDNGYDDGNFIISNLNEALLVKDIGNGSVDTNSGDFNIAILDSSMIINGEERIKFNPFIAHGNTNKVLNSIEAIGNDLMLKSSADYCMKNGQSIPIAYGQPTVLLHGIHTLY